MNKKTFSQDHAKQLLQLTNQAIGEYLELPDENRTNEPLNLADLGAREVHYAINDWGDEWWEVVIEEAAPYNCPLFCAFVTEYLETCGWSVSVRTEW